VFLAEAATATPRWLKRVSNARPRDGRLRPLWVDAVEKVGVFDRATVDATYLT
jgi:hypothetical protein